VQGQTINSVTSKALPSLTVPSSVSKTFPARGEKTDQNLQVTKKHSASKKSIHKANP